MKIRSVLFLTLAAAASSASAQTVLIGDFENSLGAWEREGGAVNDPLTFSTTTGVTNGTYSVLARVNPGYQQFLKTFDFSLSNDLLRQGGTLTYDITIPTGEFTGAGGWFETFAAWTGQVTNYANQIVPIANDGTTKSITITLPTVPQTQDFYGIFIGTNNDPSWTVPAGGASVYIDNVRFTPVPEPASMAVLGLGLAAFRKRRKG